MKMPKVSVLIPAYNAEKFIQESIESVLGQTYQDFEVIVANDCSTDNTLHIITEFAKKDPRIHIVNNQKNLGIAGNRNTLKKLAQGEYIMWQDADDISFPDRMEKQVAFLDSHSEVGICGGGLEIFNQDGIVSVREYESDDYSLRKKIFRRSPVAQPASMIRKSVLDEMGDYDIAYPPAEDLDMSFRIGKVHQFGNVEGLVLRYREVSTGATFSKLSTMELYTLSIRLRYSKTPGYTMSFIDHMYSIIQYISIFIVPPQLKITLFHLLRKFL